MFEFVFVFSVNHASSAPQLSWYVPSVEIGSDVVAPSQASPASAGIT